MADEHEGSKRRREHFSAVLPFSVTEKIVDKPCKIRGIAMTAGMSRNRNVYTAEELQAFAPKLVGAAVYMEHVSAVNAVGKVTKTEWVAPYLWYEAEIYDDQVAEQIRLGLIQHVSVGADYDALDVVDAAIPHGLHDAELSLVAVPGIPETNIQILERLRESLTGKGHAKLKLSIKELLEPLTCVFCGQPGEFLVSVCTSCGDKANAAAAVIEQVDPLIAGEYFLGFYQDPALFLPEHFRTVWLDQANGVLAVMAKARSDPAQERCQAILFLKGKWQPNTVADWLVIHPDYSVPANGSASQAVQSGVESLKEEELKELIKVGVAEGLRAREQADADKQAQIERSQKYGIGIKQGGAITKPGEFSSVPDDQFADPVNYRYPVDKEHAQAALSYFNQPDNRADYSAEEQAKIMAKIVQSALAAGVEVKYQANDAAYKALPEELKAKCSGYVKEATDAEKLAEATSKITVANKTIEDLRKQLPGGGLLVNPPKMMPVTEAVAVLEAVLPAPIVERSAGLGMQRMCQGLRSEILKLKDRAGAK